ncbi:MAG: hypothetical protein R3E53_11760 [Myxococcota bacterium]
MPQRYDHAGTAYPGDHRVNLDCTDCHGGNNAVVTWSNPTYQPECAGSRPALQARGTPRPIRRAERRLRRIGMHSVQVAAGRPGSGREST